MQNDTQEITQINDPSLTPSLDLEVQEQPRKLLWILIVLALAICLIIVVMAFFIKSTSRTSKEQKLVAQQDLQVSEMEIASESKSPITSSESVLTSLNIDIQWQDDQLTYDVQRVFLIPDPSASSSAELQPSGQLLVFAVKATDTRTFGDTRLVPARNYLNIRRLSQDYPPIGEDSQQLLPGVTTMIYVPFTIPVAEQKVTGLLGNLRNPYVVELDFQTGEQLGGSFDLITGYSPSLILESSTPSTEATSSATQPTESN